MDNQNLHVSSRTDGGARWGHPHVSLEEVIEYAAGFLELLVLASGLQSSGHSILWTTDEVQKAFGWATILEKVMAELLSSEDGVSRSILDTALAELMASAPTLPPGLPYLSSENLSNARRLLLQALLQAVGRNPAQFASVLNSVREVDGIEGNLWAMVEEEVCARHRALASVISLQKVFEVAGQNVTPKRTPCNNSIPIWQSVASSARGDWTRPEIDDGIHEVWVRSAFEYVTSSTTVYKLAGASLIFKASQAKWRDVLESLQNLPLRSAQGSQIQSSAEIAELCCLQLATPDWKRLTSKLVAFTGGLKPVIGGNYESAHKQPHQGKHLPFVELDGREGVEEYLMELMGRHVELWWYLPPVLLAAASATWFSLFDAYVEFLAQFVDRKESSCKCTCHFQKTCRSCKKCPLSILERLWCLQLPRLNLRDSNELALNNLLDHLRN